MENKTEQDYTDLEKLEYVSENVFRNKRSQYKIGLIVAFNKTIKKLEKKYKFTFKVSDNAEDYVKEFSEILKRKRAKE